MTDDRGRIARVLAGKSVPIALGVLSGLLLLPALWGGFQLDDHFQRFRLLGLGEPSIQLFVFFDGDPERNRLMMELGNLPWWAAENLRHANFRYLSVLTMQLDYLLWPNSSALQHLHSLVWLVALVAAVGYCYRRLLGATWVAGLATLLYALDDAHAIPAAYLANRNALIATFFGVLALLCFARWREDGWRPGAVLGPLSLALALAAGEMGVSAAAFLFAYALCLEHGSLVKRALGLVPSAVVLVTWALIRRLGGFGSEGSGFYVDPLADPLAFLTVLAERALFLLMGQWTPVPASFALSDLTVGDGMSGLHWFGVGTFAVIGALLAPLVHRDRVARFWLLATLLSLVPVAATGPENRLLGFVGIGSMALLAQLVSGLLASTPPLPSARLWRSPAVALSVLLLVVHVPLGAVLGLASVDFHNGVAANLERALASVPHDAAISEQDLIVVNPPDYIYTVSAIRPAKASRGQAAPRRIRALSAGGSPVELTRTGAHTLEVRLALGLFTDAIGYYYRSAALPFAVGERVELSGLTAEIVTASDGEPDTIRYHFERPLEDPAYRFLCWQDGAYRECAPPAVGESLAFPPSVGIFG